MANAEDIMQAVNDKSDRIIYEVAPRGYGLFGWKLVNVSEAPSEVIAPFKTKAEAVSYARTYMWDLWYQQGEKTELSIKNRWGRITEKNTYPRSSDPVGSEG